MLGHGFPNSDQVFAGPHTTINGGAFLLLAYHTFLVPRRRQRIETDHEYERLYDDDVDDHDDDVATAIGGLVVIVLAAAAAQSLCFFGKLIGRDGCSTAPKSKGANAAGFLLLFVSRTR
jgi:hypothetical protein